VHRYHRTGRVQQGCEEIVDLGYEDYDCSCQGLRTKVLFGDVEQDSGVQLATDLRVLIIHAE